MTLDQIYLGLSLVEGIGPKTISKLRDKLGDLTFLLNMESQELEKKSGLKSDMCLKIKNSLKSERLKKEIQWAEKNEAKIICFENELYPSVLKEIYSPPAVLFYKGCFPLEFSFALAFVGARKASFYGKSTTKKLIKELAHKFPELVIVSGLALGIDTEAHKAALDYGLKTISVLGSGIGKIYPPQNEELSHQISLNGALISEQSVYSPPRPTNFPLRNRIISGLSKGVIIVEAAEKSGALITARYSIEQNRELFALPGLIDSPFYKGTNKLIQKQQAKLITCADDILEEFHYLSEEQTSYLKESNSQESSGVQLNELESKIVDSLEEKELHIEELSRMLDLGVNELLPQLISLEMRDIIIGKVGNRYQKLV